MEPNMKISVLMDFGGIQPSKIAIIQEITAMALDQIQDVSTTLQIIFPTLQAVTAT
jgi:hypothetical protein